MNAFEQLLGRRALQDHGARIALEFGEQAVTYAELAALATRAARAWKALGAQPGDRVVIMMRDSPAFAAAWLGALHCGAVAVAVSTKLTEAEFRHVRRDSEARVVVVEDTFAQARPDLTAEFAAEGALAVAGEAQGARSWDAGLAEGENSAPFPANLDDPAFWLYSSGTTGMPKGIIHTHRSVLPVGQAQREIVGLVPGDKVIATSKLFFAYALEHGLLGPLATGATSVLDPDWPDAERVLRSVARHRPTAFFSVPTMYQRLLALGGDRLEPFRAVRGFVAAGERLPGELVRRWQAATGGEILSLYGMSETFCAAIVTPRGSSTGPRTGLPLRGVDVRLATVDGRAVTDGEPGVLWMRHPGLALGYVHRPEQTAAQFRDGWFCTKDMFVRDAEGFYCHQGRADELLKISGQWIRPGELEEAVAGAEGVLEAACVPVPDAEGLDRLALFITAQGDPAVALAAAASRCEERLPRHKRPRWLRAVADLPRTATGKVQRFRLRELLERELAEAPHGS